MRCAQNMYDELSQYFKDGDGGSLIKLCFGKLVLHEKNANIFIKADALAMKWPHTIHE